jgi:hypothetical protein
MTNRSEQQKQNAKKLTPLTRCSAAEEALVLHYQKIVLRMTFAVDKSGPFSRPRTEVSSIQ